MDLFVIPTHRLCENAVKSVCEEIREFYDNKEKTGILVLDNSKDNTYLKNKEFLEELKKSQKYIIYHLGLEDMKTILNELSKNCSISYEELIDMFYPDKIDYGKIGNFIYLTAVLLGADQIHRRDSDCFIWGLEPEKYPAKPEQQFLGKKVSEISGVHKQEEIQYQENEKICIVGGDYTGNWDLDTQKVNELNPDAMKYMMRICGISEQDINEQFDMKYKENVDEKNNLPVLSSIFEVSQSPECGNISMCEVYRYIPNFVGENGIGFDNHTYFMSFLVKVPLIYHFNRIIHMHDKNRTKDINLIHYWRGIAKMVDFDTYHLAFIEAGCGDMICKEGYGINALQRTYQKILPDLLEKIMKQLNYDARVNRIEVIAEKILKPTGLQEYIEIADYLQKEKHNIIAELDKEYKLSIKIQKNWSAVIAALDKMYRTKSFKFNI